MRRDFHAPRGFENTRKKLWRRAYPTAIDKMFRDPEIKGIWCVRGGYGCTRILPALDYRVIRQNPKVTAINSAIEVDITGQVCADSIGTKISLNSEKTGSSQTTSTKANPQVLKD